MAERRGNQWLIRLVDWWRETSVLTLLTSLVLAAVALALVILALGRDPIQSGALFFRGAFGSETNLIETILKALPLTLAGLGAAVAFRAGAFNVGIEGQLTLGALAAAFAGYRIHLPPVIHVVAVLLAGMVAGGLYGFIPGWLKVRRQVNEIISSIMLNYPAFYFTHWAIIRVSGKGSVMPATPFIDLTARLPIIIPGTRLHAGILLAIFLPFAIWYLLERTVLGYELRAVGHGPKAARLAGIRADQRAILAMVLSGALAGLAGAVEVAGVHYRLYDQLSPGYGFEAINVALVALLGPLAVPFSALFFGALKTGSTELQAFAKVPRQIGMLYQGIILAFIAGQKMVAGWVPRLRRRTDGAGT